MGWHCILSSNYQYLCKFNILSWYDRFYVFNIKSKCCPIAWVPSFVESSELESQEMSNVIPQYLHIPSVNRMSEDFEETNNQIDTNIQQPYSMLNQQVPGLNQNTGCPDENPYELCPFDPCAGCNNPNIQCFISFCGKCQAIYIDLSSGEASNRFAAVCWAIDAVSARRWKVRKLTRSAEGHTWLVKWRMDSKCNIGYRQFSYIQLTEPLCAAYNII